jgi:hypothetical protein
LKKRGEFMKDEGVTESQVYSNESPRLSTTVGENSRDLILFTFPISLSSLGEGFFLLEISAAGNLRRDQQAAPRREKSK